MSDEEEKLKKYADMINQKQFEEWEEGKISIADLVKKHPFIASLYKSKIENAIHHHTAHQFLYLFEEERPDLDFGDEEEVEERIKEEIKEVESAL
ncbi:MAG: hypothetical protein ACOC5D_06460 [Thermoplasmatota archaeon]